MMETEYEIPNNDHIYDTMIGAVTPRCRCNRFSLGDLNSQEKYGYTEKETSEYTAQQGVSNILCTYCIEKPQQAVKHCLMCDVSLCLQHMQVHSKSGEHVLTEPMRPLWRASSVKYTNRKKHLKVHFSEDNPYSCAPCYQCGNYKIHKTPNELLDDASQRKNKDLQNVKEKLVSNQKETEERVHHLQKQTIAVEERGTEISKRVTALFRNIRAQLDDLELRVLSDISGQQKNISRPLSLLINQLELKTNELSKSIKQIEELCTLPSPIPALQQNKFAYWESRDGENTVYDLDDFNEGLISMTLQSSLNKIMASAKWEQGASDILLDVNTAANNVYLSGDKKTLSWSKINQHRQKNLNRFKGNQVLSNVSYSSGRHYWEVETSVSGKWVIGMCYPSIDRKGDQSHIGSNNKSWGLGMLDKYKVVHDHKDKEILNLGSSNRIGIYLDYEAGQLSFYELCDPIRHLHTFTATFTEPLHAVFWVWYGWVRITS